MGINKEKQFLANYPMNVLVSAFACGNNWGSEVGMGWNWVTNLSNYCRMHVITEKSFKSEIEKGLNTVRLKYVPEFYYIDIGKKGLTLFWRQGDWRFYHYYKIWQKKAFLLARDICKQKNIQLTHQLNLIGYREPGYLWKLNIPHIWGPINGYQQMPWAYVGNLGLKGGGYYTARNILNRLQMVLNFRIHLAVKNTKKLICATKEDQRAIKGIYGIHAALLNETGTNKIERMKNVLVKKKTNKIELVWAGVFQGRKALPILLSALTKVKSSDLYKLQVVGDGPERNNWQNLCKKKGLEKRVIWHGRVPHWEALQIIRQCDALVFTSLQEGTPAVVLEAIENGLAVICHDACGFGDIVTSSCGIKIPLSTPKESIKGFAEALEKIKDKTTLMELKKGALDRNDALTWDNKAMKMVEYYKEVIS
jgi:glycosyltransferase involved in cell wall biosynthesis